MPQPLSLWSWAPQFYFPWSGGVMQRIDPNVNWLSDLISPGAGNGAIEGKVFTDIASYGKQLGLITEIVLALAEDKKPEQESITKLDEIKKNIDALKTAEYSISNYRIAEQVRDVRDHGGTQLKLLAEMLAPLLAKKTNPEPYA